jgi:polyisoprenoid-binding protein YceI
MKRTIIIALLIALIPASAISQAIYKQENQTFVLSGTSNLQDWVMISKEASGSAVIDMKDDKIYSISQLQISIPAESLKSNKPGMDRIAFKAMRTNNYPTILYTLKEVVRMVSNGNEIEMKVRGQLILSGIERELEMTVKGTVKYNHIIFEGSAPVRMTDHNIEPPVALFGTVKTADETSVYFKINFTKKQEFNQQSEKSEK